MPSNHRQEKIHNREKKSTYIQQVADELTDRLMTDIAVTSSLFVSTEHMKTSKLEENVQTEMHVAVKLLSIY